MKMTEHFVCPYCRTAAVESGAALACPSCSRSFPVRDGIPIFFEVSRDHADSETMRRLIEELKAGAQARGGRDGRFVLPDRKWDLSARASENKSFRSFARHFDPSALRILVVSAGAGREVNRLIKAGAREIYYTDLSFEAARYVKETVEELYPGRGKDVHGFVTEACLLPFPDGYFDLLLVYASLHHYPDMQVFIREAHRVARNICILSEPAVMPVFQPLLELVRWDKLNDYSKDIDTHRVAVKSCRKLLETLYRGVRVERLWTFYPRFLGRWGNSAAFVAFYFGLLRFLDLFFGWCSHSVNFYGLGKR
ncbi:MAG: methyltransferase domain-containing protein [Endomicrobiales bacterium]